MTSKQALVLQRLTMGFPQGFLVSPVLFNVYDKKLADLNGNGLARAYTLAQVGCDYEAARDTQKAATAVQEQLDKVSEWCKETGLEINLFTY